MASADDESVMAEAGSKWPRFEEPVRRTLLRNLAIAIAVASIATWIGHDPRLFVPIAGLALWPTLGGHLVELAFLNFVRSRIPRARHWQVAARLFVWFVGGCVLYLCMLMTARALSLVALPIGFLPWSGLAFIGIELLVHAGMAVRRKPNFFDARQ